MPGGTPGSPPPGQRARPGQGARREPGKPGPGTAGTGEGRTSAVMAGSRPERYLAAATPPAQALCWPQLLREWLAGPDARPGRDPTGTAAAGKAATSKPAGDRDSHGSQTWSG
jgi:hypothetical protein